MLGIDVGLNSFQIFDDLFHRNHVGKLGFHVKQVPLNNARNTVAHSSLRNNGLKAVSGGIHDRMPYAGTGCGAHDNHRIHTQEIQGLGQMGPEEVGSIFFMDNRLLRARFQLGVDFQPLGIDIQGAHRYLFIPAGKIPLLFSYVSGGGVEDGNARFAAGFQYL